MISIKNGKYISTTQEGTFEITKKDVHYSAPALFVELLRSTTEENLKSKYLEAKELYRITEGVYKAEDIDKNKVDELFEKVITEIAKQDCDPLIAKYAAKYMFREYAYWIKTRQDLGMAETVFSMLCGPIMTLRFTEVLEHELYYSVMGSFYYEFGLYDFMTNYEKEYPSSFDHYSLNLYNCEHIEEDIVYSIDHKTMFDRQKRRKWSRASIDLIHAPSCMAEIILNLNKTQNQLDDSTIQFYKCTNSIMREMRDHLDVPVDYEPDTAYIGFKKGNYLTDIYELSKKIEYYPGQLFIAERIMSDKLHDEVASIFGYTDIYTYGADSYRRTKKAKKIARGIALTVLAIFACVWLWTRLGILGAFFILLALCSFGDDPYPMSEEEKKRWEDSMSYNSAPFFNGYHSNIVYIYQSPKHW